MTAETHTWECLKALKYSFKQALATNVLCRADLCPWSLSAVPPWNNRDTVILVYFQCNAILWFYLVPCDLTSAITLVCWRGNTKSRSAKQQNHSDYTHTETYTNKCPPLLLLVQSINWTVHYWWLWESVGKCSKAGKAQWRQCAQFLFCCCCFC